MPLLRDYQRSQQPAQPQSYLNAPNFSNIDYLWATGALDLLNMLKYYQENYTDPKAHEYANMVRNEITRTQPYIEGVGETFGLRIILIK